MKDFKEYVSHEAEIKGKRKKIDNTIYTFDIETTSYLVLNNKIISGVEYDNLTEDEKEEAIKCACMYEWTFGINDEIYFGRTWEEFIYFLMLLRENDNHKKIVFVHNLAFEFQFIKSILNFERVFAREKHKVMFAYNEEFNIEFRCTYLMSNASLSQLPKLFKLPVQKLVRGFGLFTYKN